jgi:hypothetical protein
MKMKAKTIRRAMELRLFAVFLLATSAFAVAANAQPFSGNFTLPFETHWGKNVLPAGDYTINLNSLTNVAVVRSADGKTARFTPIPITTSSDKGPTALLVMVRGNERIVRSLNLPANGISLIYVPATAAEREMLAKAAEVQAVPVITARK